MAMGAIQVKAVAAVVAVLLTTYGRFVAALGEVLCDQFLYNLVDVKVTADPRVP